MHKFTFGSSEMQSQTHVYIYHAATLFAYGWNFSVILSLYARKRSKCLENNYFVIANLKSRSFRCFFITRIIRNVLLNESILILSILVIL